MRDKLYVIYGDQPEEMAYTVMQEMKVAAELAALAEKLEKELLIGLKPNLVVAQPADWGATTSPEMVRGVIRYLQDQGFSQLKILESAWIGDSTKKAFQVCGYQAISQEFNIPLIDLKDDQGVKRLLEHPDGEQTDDNEGIEVCSQVLEVDYLINMPVLKAHCQTKLTCALKNLKGCIPDREKRRFHTMGLHKPIALLNKVLTSHLTLVDGIIGDLTFEEGGTPVRMNRLIAGRDPVLLDAYAAQLIGYQVEQISYIKLAAQLGVGSDQYSDDLLMELNSKKEAQVPEPGLASDTVEHLAQWIVEDQACSACYGSAIHALMRLQEQGKLKDYHGKLHVGQGLWNLEPPQEETSAPPLGIGRCANMFPHQVPGCPPKASEIIKRINEVN